MNDIRTFLVKGLEFGQNGLNDPFFSLNGTNFVGVFSVNEFKRDLEEGGFSTDKLLSCVIRMLDDDLNSIYSFVPQPQQVITYKGEQFRIETIKPHSTDSYMRIIAMSSNRGI